MPYIKLNTLNFYYEVEGTGFPLVLLSGLACDSTHWNFVKPFLTQHFQVITFDNRSVGRSETPSTSYTLGEMAKDVVCFLDYLHLSKVHILGHSMGGAIAQIISHQYSGYVERLIISHSFAKIKPRGFFWMQHCASLYDAQKNIEETVPVVTPWIFSNNFFENPKRVEELLMLKKNDPYPQSACGFRQQIEAIKTFNSSAWIHEISLPTCVIAGKEDILTPADQSYYLHQQIQNSHLILQEGAHAPMFEMPEAYAEDVRRFLQMKFDVCLT